MNLSGAVRNTICPYLKSSHVYEVKAISCNTDYIYGQSGLIGPRRSGATIRYIAMLNERGMDAPKVAQTCLSPKNQRDI